MSEITRIGVDASKHVFQLHGVDAGGDIGALFERPIALAFLTAARIALARPLLCRRRTASPVAGAAPS